ncbi:protein of unknown function DUF3168 [Gottschalkia purinilytica]|uniref:Uncharacterized protein n=1 Tax=Gottschalkia purinilytica TaxID=1503 RepID=A0A0L0W6A3_GOTPU|nr:hypothetical protein [Gottschalkia purinilytica]KNF07007.1 protein of unknown function DUF3168 [Gottschalkia purinilytica]
MIDLVYDTLKSIGIPIKYQTYSGDKKTYITYFTYLQQAETYADDEEQTEGYYIQVDIWSNTSGNDYTNTIKQVKGLMKQAGFRRKTEHEDYESDTKIYHKAIRFVYYK